MDYYVNEVDKVWNNIPIPQKVKYSVAEKAISALISEIVIKLF